MAINMIQIQEVIDNFPGLSIKKSLKKQKIISGKFRLNDSYNGVRMVDDFEIEITIYSNYPEILPKIKEIGNKIDPKYGHIYLDRSLCLATEGDMKINLFPNFKLIDWMNNYVIPYFYSYSYYKKYNGVYPFGDRSHGAKGILEYYVEFFKVNNLEEAREYLKIVSKKEYKGHYLCPCGSGKKIRNCHKEKIYKLMNPEYCTFYKDDLNMMLEEEKNYD